MTRNQQVKWPLEMDYLGHPYYVSGNAIYHALAEGFSGNVHYQLHARHEIFTSGKFGTFPEEHSESGNRPYLVSGLPDVERYDDLFLFRHPDHPWLLDSRLRDGMNVHPIRTQHHQPVMAYQTIVGWPEDASESVIIKYHIQYSSFESKETIRHMNLAQSSLKVFTAKAVGAVIGFIGIAFFARELGAHQLGVFFLFQSVLGMIGIPADFGLGGAVTKRISEGKPVDEIFSTALLLKLIPVTLIATGILLFSNPINKYLGAELAKFLIVAIVLQTIAGLTIQVLRGELRVGETALPSLSRQVVYVGIGAALVILGFGTFALVYGLLSGIIVMLTWGVYRSSITIGRPSLVHARSLFDYSKYNIVSSIGGYFYSWMDIAIIGLFLAQSHVAAYEIAWRVTSITVLFSQAISTTIFPQISAWEAEEAKEQIETLLPKAITPSIVLVIPAFFGTLLFSREILGLIFGPEYTVAWLVLIILMVDKITEGVQVVLGRALQAVNQPDLAAQATVVAILLNLVLNFILIWQFGIVGAAIATTVASFVGGVYLHAKYLSRIVEVRIPYREIMACVTAAIGMEIVLFTIMQWIVVDTLITLFVLICFGAFIYGIFIMLSPGLRSRIFNQTQNILKSIQ